MPGELRLDLDAFLSAQPEVDHLSAFIPRLEASASALIAATRGVLTAVYVRIPGGVIQAAGDVVRELVVKWVMKKFEVSETSAKESVIIFDQFGKPCVRVELDSIPTSKH
jgi:hypothetical protein